MGISCCPAVTIRLRHRQDGNRGPSEDTDSSDHVPVPLKFSKVSRANRRIISSWQGDDRLRDAFIPLLQQSGRSPPPSRPPPRYNRADCHTITQPGLNCCSDGRGAPVPNGQKGAGAVGGDLSLRVVAAAVNPLMSLFSYPHGHCAGNDNNNNNNSNGSRDCVRCPYCKGCQAHLQNCSGAYGLRHRMNWILNRTSPAPALREAVEAPPQPHWVCRFEVGPVVITRRLTFTSPAQVKETFQRGGHTGPFAGIICPRPLYCIDVFAGIFFGTTRRRRDKTFYHSIQCTCMRAVAAQAKALWELFTFSPERGGHPEHHVMHDEDDIPPPHPPRRVPMDWKYAPWFFSLASSSVIGPIGERGGVCHDGIGFHLWLSYKGQHLLAAHVMDEREFWKFPHTCRLKIYEWKKGGENENDSPTETDNEENDSNGTGKWEGEVKCSRCYVPPAWWGLVLRRHLKEKDVAAFTLRSRKACNRRRKERQGSNIFCINQRKTRSQFMALLVAYMMRSTVCGPYKQYRLCEK